MIISSLEYFSFTRYNIKFNHINRKLEYHPEIYQEFALNIALLILVRIDL